MEFFKSFLRVIGLLQPAKVDFISELPLEVSQLILRKLDPESLLCVAQVSRNWLNVCSSDKSLRQSARRHKRRNKRRMMKAFVDQGFPELPKMDVRKKQLQRKRILRDAPCKFEAAIVFGRTDRRVNFIRQDQISSPLALRNARYMRM
ncbi:probable E3 ubiquitin ligase complex SCF subunit scon-2 [Colletes gigas]|uniref:probable E3 ubiquitin ligase complex SCF subunit scon-2 n=1 Tax=Colletes gigas TaxID=935657 RepID=UPI001C9A6AE4|nr:probable E3 ubiquitin ligase complex SCF subunit scon-2 [Colletes gigas]